MKNKILRSLLLTSIFTILSLNTIFAQSFSDINTSDWFYSDVIALSNRGIINGYEDKSFKPNNNVTNIEALKMIMETSGFEPNISENWAEGYVTKARELNLIDSNFEQDELITREEMAELLVKALGEEPVLYSSNYFVDTSNKYVEKLYQKGFVSGNVNDGKYYFNPKMNITRAEISAILNRTFNEKIVKEPFLTSEIALVKSPYTVNEFIDAYVYMAYNSIDEYTFTYDLKNLDREEMVANAKTAFGISYCAYPEVFSAFNGAQYEMEIGSDYLKLKLTIDSDILDTNDALEYNQVLLEEAKRAVEKLVESGKITSEMTQTEKAKVVYEYVCLNVEYDLADDVGYTGYSAIHNGEAVCQGYTSLFNLMCRYLGIYNIQAITGFGQDDEPHMWTGVILDNKPTLIDTTWGDLGGEQFTYEWFDPSIQKFKEEHTWDENTVFIW